MDLVLDASALLSGMMTSIPAGYDNIYITTLVKNEIARGKPSKMLHNLLEMGLRVRDPEDDEAAIEASSATGDSDMLSAADISVIALAIELRDVEVITDDFRVQNVLSSLNIAFHPGGEVGGKTIRDVWEWTFRCRGCGRFFEKEPGQECPVCGSQVKRTRKKLR